MCSIHDCPREILCQIILHFPIGYDLSTLRLLCKGLFAPLVNFDVVLAQQHISQHIPQHFRERRQPIYLLYYERFYWKALPLAYKTAMLILVFAKYRTDNIPAVGDKMFTGRSNNLRIACDMHQEAANIVVALAASHQAKDTIDPNWLMLWACCQKQHAILTWLLNGNDSVKQQPLLLGVPCPWTVDPSFQSNRALYEAITNQDNQIAKLILRDPRTDISLDDYKIFREYPLAFPTSPDFVEVVEMILNHPRADAAAVAPKLLYKAAFWKNSEAIEYILKACPDVDPTVQHNNILLSMCEWNAPALKRLLRDRRVDPSAEGNKAIQISVRAGMLENVVLLLQDERVDPSADNNFAIKRAATQNHKDSLEIMALLLNDSRVDPCVDDNEVIRSACRLGRTSIVDLLLKDGRADPTALSNSCLKIAQSKKFQDIVDLLMKDERVQKSLDWGTFMK